MSPPSKPRRRPSSGPVEGKGQSAPRVPSPAEPIDADTLDEAFVKALQADFIAHGKSAIAAMRVERPTDYVKIIGTLRAKAPNDAADALQGMSDAELDRRIQELARRAGYDIRSDGAATGGDATANEGADAD